MYLSLFMLCIKGTPTVAVKRTEISLHPVMGIILNSK